MVVAYTVDRHFHPKFRNASIKITLFYHKYNHEMLKEFIILHMRQRLINTITRNVTEY